MAIIYKNNQEDQDQQQQNAAQPAQAPIASPAPITGPAGSFSGLTNYLQTGQANQAPKASNEGSAPTRARNSISPTSTEAPAAARPTVTALGNPTPPPPVAPTSNVSAGTPKRAEDAQGSGQNAAPAPIQTNGGETGTITAGTPANSSGGSTNPNGSGQQGTKSGTFTNLQSYLNANKNTNLGNLAVNNVQKQADTIGTGIQQASNDFSTAANAAKTTAAAGNSIFNPTFDPTKLTDDQKTALGTTLAASVPTLTYGNDQLTEQVNHLNDISQKTGNQNDREALLQAINNKPKYSQGMSALDNLFLQGNPQAVSSLNQLGNVGQGLAQQYVQSGGSVANPTGLTTPTLSDADAQRQAVSDAIAAEKTKALGSLGTYASGITGGIDQNIANSNDAATKAYNQELSDLRNSNSNADMLKKYNLTSDEKNWFYQHPDQITNFVQAPAQHTIENTSTPENVAQLSALQGLLGNYGSDDLNALLSKYNVTPSTYTATPGIDTNALEQAIHPYIPPSQPSAPATSLVMPTDPANNGTAQDLGLAPVLGYTNPEGYIPGGGINKGNRGGIGGPGKTIANPNYVTGPIAGYTANDSFVNSPTTGPEQDDPVANALHSIINGAGGHIL